MLTCTNRNYTYLICLKVFLANCASVCLIFDWMADPLLCANTCNPHPPLSHCLFQKCLFVCLFVCLFLLFVLFASHLTGWQIYHVPTRATLILRSLTVYFKNAYGKIITDHSQSRDALDPIGLTIQEATDFRWSCMDGKCDFYLKPRER